MARIGVNYVDVSTAAKQIQDSNEEPTVDRVRALLGTGSKSTIGPLLKKWKSQKDEKSSILSGESLDDEIILAAKQLSSRINALADERIMQSQAEVQSIKENCSKQIADAQLEINDLTVKNTQLKTETAKLEADNAHLNSELTINNLTNTKLALTVDQKTQEIEQLKNEIIELKQEKRDVREHFEHFQEQTALDRNQEREQFRGQINNYDHQLSELKNAMAKVVFENTKMQDSQVFLNKEMMVIKLENQNLSEHKAMLIQKSNQFESDFKQINSDFTSTRAEHNQCNIDLVKAVSEAQNERNQLGVAQKENTKLEQKIMTLTQRIDQLIEKNIVAQQESSKLEWQIQQATKK
ncbi:DNA-binding protein [Marinicellulosiphila megalodicopiae]|uniref:DNA-binding protein n=1 Tax=Marinicellulosiphila megalodicopiae TaxID=2724896 RepID=UPI003BAFAD2B